LLFLSIPNPREGLYSIFFINAFLNTFFSSFFQLHHALNRQKVMFENVNIDWNLSHEDGSTDFSDEETLEDQQQPRTLTRTPDRKNRPMSVYPSPILNGGVPIGGGLLLQSPPSAPLAGAESAPEDSPDNGNRSHGSNSSDWSRSNTSDSGDSPGSYRNSSMPPPPPPQSKKPPSLCKSAYTGICCRKPTLDVSVWCLSGHHAAPPPPAVQNT
jgi:Arf-GAP/SH3 domain/ANK repeat/PH domain-containing protein